MGNPLKKNRENPSEEERFLGFPVTELAKMVKFGITGVVNTAVDYAVFFLLARLLGFNAYAAQAVSYGAGMLNSYFVNRSWTFRTGARFFSPQLVRFVVTNLVVLGVSMLLLKFFMEILSVDMMLAKLITICVTMALNFVISRLWVFKPEN